MSEYRAVEPDSTLRNETIEVQNKRSPGRDLAETTGTSTDYKESA